VLAEAVDDEPRRLGAQVGRGRVHRRADERDRPHELRAADSQVGDDLAAQRVAEQERPLEREALDERRQRIGEPLDPECVA
jgi:hypothetical protein